jgi:hypothetical protein
MVDTKLEIHRDQTLSDAVEIAWKVRLIETGVHAIEAFYVAFRNG